MTTKHEKRNRSVNSGDINDLYGASIPGHLIVKNYGSIYKTTGGGFRTDKAYRFVRKFLDNRVLDLYLKYLGITTLTPSTLVPITLILGQQAFKHTLKYMKRQEQTGGSIPILDNTLVGNYLKLAGLTQLNLSLHTLVPLGLAMAIYKTFYKEHKKKKLRGEKGEKGEKGVKTHSQKGGQIARFLTNSSVPPGVLQLGNRYWNGQSVPNNIGSPLSGWQQLHRPLSYMNHELQTPCDAGCCTSSDTYASLDNLSVTVAGIGDEIAPTDNVAATRSPSSLPDGNFIKTGNNSYMQLKGLDGPDRVMRNQMAGARKSKSRRRHSSKKRY